MDDFKITQHPDMSEGGGSTTTLFLGLYLLVLAFFILLVSISTRETIRSQAVMDSLTSAFSAVLPPRTDLTAFNAKQGNVLARLRFQEEITKIFTTAMSVARIRVVRPGRLMQIVVPTDTIFFAGEARIRPPQYALMDRIVTTLSGAPAGLRYELEFVVGTPGGAGGALDAQGSLEMRRAATFARELTARGGSRRSLAIGLKPGDPARTVISFYVRAEDEGLVAVGGRDD